MSYTSRVSYTATAGQTEFDLTFPYLDRTHVRAEVGGVWAPYNWVTSTRIALQTPATLGAQVHLIRETPVATALADFENGAILTGQDLNLNTAQALYRTQELADDIIDVQFSGVAGVSSVNGETGIVDLSAADVGAAATSHTHAIANVTGLQAALDAKAALASPALTGNPTAPTATAGDNDTSIATTSFVQTAISTKAPLDSPALTGTPTAPTAAPGTNNTRIASTAFVTAAVAAGGGGGGGAAAQKPTLLSALGTIDGGGVATTGNDTALTAAEADTDTAFYVPDGVYATTKNKNTLSKGYTGRGVILSGSDALPAKFSYMAAKPTTWPVQGVGGWFRGDQRFTDGGEWKIIGPDVRTYDLNSRYFESNVIPHHGWFDIYSGNSGAQAYLTSGATAGASTITLHAAPSAEWVGKTVAIGASMDGVVSETKVVASVNIGAKTVTFTTPIANSYTWSPPTLTPVIFFGKRTNNSHTYTKLKHYGGGDSYGNIVRMDAYYTPKASETHTFMAATMGQYGGDVYAFSDGIYIQTMESQLQGQAFDVAAIGWVESFVRNKDYDLQGGKYWAGIHFQSTGTRPSDTGMTLAGIWRNGFDTAGHTTFMETSRLTTAASTGAVSIVVASVNGAHLGDPIQIGEAPGTIYSGTITGLNAGTKTLAISPPLTANMPLDTYVQYTVGGAALNLKSGNRIVWNSTISATGRSGDALNVYPSFYGNQQGDLIMESGQDGVSEYWSVRFARGASYTAPDTTRIRLRPSQIQLFGATQVNGGIGLTGDITMLDGAKMSLGSGVWIDYVAGNVRVTKNGGASFTNIL